MAHYRIRLYSRLPGDEGRESLERAAEAAAEAAAATLAYAPDFGTEASVEWEIVLGDRTVPTQAPDRRSVVSVSQLPAEDEEDEVEVDVVPVESLASDDQLSNDPDEPGDIPLSQEG